MGMIDPMAINNTVFSGVIQFGSSLGLWVSLVGVLAVATLGIGMAGRRRPRVAVALRQLRPAAAH